MFAKVTKKYPVALNKGLDGVRNYYPGDVAEDRHAEIGIEMGCAVEIEAKDAELPPDHPSNASTDKAAKSGEGTGSDEDEITQDDIKSMLKADLIALHDEEELNLQGFKGMFVPDMKAALIGHYWPDEKATKPAENKAQTPPKNKAAD